MLARVLGDAGSDSAGRSVRLLCAVAGGKM